MHPPASVGPWWCGCSVDLLPRWSATICVLPPASLHPQKGHASIVQLLLSVGADKDAATENGWTPLHIASRVCMWWVSTKCPIGIWCGNAMAILDAVVYMLMMSVSYVGLVGN